MAAPIAIVALIVSIVTVIILVIAMIMFFVLARQLDGTNKNSLNVAAILTGISIPFVIVSGITAFMYFSGLRKGEKKTGLRLLLIISTLVGGLLVFIGTVIGFVIGGRDDDATRKRNIQAAAGIAFTMGGILVLAMIALSLFMKPKEVMKVKSRSRKQIKSGDVYRKPSVVESAEKDDE